MTTDQLETLGAMVRAGVKPVIVTEESPKWSRIILPLLFVLCVVVAVGLNSAMYGGGR
jgi:hypothetical protein